MAEQIHVVLAANEAYGPFCAAAIRSLFATASDPSQITAHVLTAGFKRSTADMMVRAAYEQGGATEIHRVDTAALSRLPTPAHISSDTYTRLIAADVLPNVTRLLYLDCDLIVCDDIRKLFDTDLQGHLIAGVTHRNTPIGAEFEARFGLNDLPGNYVNAGVLLVDASAWRRDGVCSELLRWLNLNASRIQYCDQDAINHHFRGRIFELPLRWNLEARHYDERLNGAAIAPAIHDALKNPAIIHYTGAIKPWMFNSFVPCREQYLRHLDAVLIGAGMQPVRRVRGLRNVIGAVRRSIRFRLGKLRRSLSRRT